MFYDVLLCLCHRRTFCHFNAERIEKEGRVLEVLIRINRLLGLRTRNLNDCLTARKKGILIDFEKKLFIHSAMREQIELLQGVQKKQKRIHHQYTDQVDTYSRFHLTQELQRMN